MLTAFCRIRQAQGIAFALESKVGSVLCWLCCEERQLAVWKASWLDEAGNERSNVVVHCEHIKLKLRKCSQWAKDVAWVGSDPAVREVSCRNENGGKMRRIGSV